MRVGHPKSLRRSIQAVCLVFVTGIKPMLAKTFLTTYGQRFAMNPGTVNSENSNQLVTSIKLYLNP